jgi:NADPH2:quinone reductase
MPMRAIRLKELGPPLEVLRLEEVPSPEPGPGEVRLRMTHRPINPSDLLSITGLYPVRPRLPGSPGSEGVGHVDALGAGVTGVPIGLRVVPLAGTPGTWAEHYTVAVNRLFPVPGSVSDEAAAQFVVNPLTAWALLNDELQLKEGDWLLVTAAGSTLGQLLRQLTRAKGIRLLAVVRRRPSAEEVRTLGDAVVCTEDEVLVERVREITAGQGVTAAIDLVGGLLGGQVAACLAPGGVMIALGVLSAERLMPLDTADLLFKGSTVRGFWLVNWFAGRTPLVLERAIREVVALMSQGLLQPPVEAEYDLADFKAAVAHAERPGRHGKVLLVG